MKEMQEGPPSPAFRKVLFVCSTIDTQTSFLNRMQQCFWNETDRERERSLHRCFTYESFSLPKMGGSQFYTRRHDLHGAAEAAKHERNQHPETGKTANWIKDARQPFS